MGDAYSKSGIYDDAVSSYKKVLEINPTDIDTLTTLADIYYDSKDFSNAALTYEKAMKLDNRQPDVYYKLGESYIKLNQSDNAKDTLSELKRRFPEYINMDKVNNDLSQLN